MISARRSLSALPSCISDKASADPARLNVPALPAWQGPAGAPAGAERRQWGSRPPQWRDVKIGSKKAADRFQKRDVMVG